MPVKKKENLKNAPQEKRDSAIVPTKDEVSKSRPRQGTQKTITKQRVNALSTAGKKKRPK
jgi:hypothetical protein